MDYLLLLFFFPNQKILILKSLNYLVVYHFHTYFPVLELDELLHWACLNGARFLKKDTVFGSLAPGKRPGIVRIGGLDASGRLTDESYSERVI